MKNKTAIIISCSKSKLSYPAPAGEMYTGKLFQNSLWLANQIGGDIYISSALHGLIKPDVVIEPYDFGILGPIEGGWRDRGLDRSFRKATIDKEIIEIVGTQIKGIEVDQTIDIKDMTDLGEEGVIQTKQKTSTKFSIFQMTKRVKSTNTGQNADDIQVHHLGNNFKKKLKSKKKNLVSPLQAF